MILTPPEDDRPIGSDEDAATNPWVLRTSLLLLLALAGLVIWATNDWLTERFSENARNRAELRGALYSGQLLSELQRNSVVPMMLARDPAVISALASDDYAITSARLISAQKELGVASIRLLDASGRTVAATDRQLLGTNFVSAPYFVDAMRARDTVFTVAPNDGGRFEFVYSRAIADSSGTLGVIVVSSDLTQLEQRWAGITDAVAVTDSTGLVIMSTETRWRGLPLEEALSLRPVPNAIERAFQVSADWTNTGGDAYVEGRAVMQTVTRVDFRGWRMHNFTTYESIRERVMAVLALEAMVFAVLAAMVFYVLSRQAQRRSVAYMRESADLRVLNARLTREIAARERVQRELRVAEQTVQQSSKLAALGEMSAGVSHELNQPLAAMKTYIAGARLLLDRGRSDEALSSFQRIDDLVDRMGAITRQLKSFARKGGEAFEPVDLRSALANALTMMEPQLRTRPVRIVRNLPRRPVMVYCDRIRLEQVLINLLRNALDATRSVRDARVEIGIESSAQALVTVRDNGPGVSDLDKLFEPFFTTKKPGEGTGLGLAISSGIVADFGGRLTAHNAQDGPGAVFELSLPLHDPDGGQAEKPLAAE